MNLLLITSAIIIVALLIGIFVISKLYKKYKTAYKDEHLQLNILQEEYSKLVEVYNIMKKNKEQADEETSNLRNGVISADDILPKRKSRK